MFRAIYTTYSGLLAHQTDLDVTANNIANVNTNSFKRSRAEFADLLYQNANLLQGIGAGDKQVGSGTNTVDVTKIFSDGSAEQTNRELDVQIVGDGFMQVQFPDGSVAYTRDGNLKVDSEGRLVTAKGLYVLPEITFPTNTSTISISPAGIVSITTTAAPNTQVTLGTLNLTRFINPQGLQAIGNNMYRETAASGEPLTGTPGAEGRGTLQQGFLERSNVDIGYELVHMILASRAFQVNTRSIIVENDMYQTANDMVRF